MSNITDNPSFYLYMYTGTTSSIEEESSASSSTQKSESTLQSNISQAQANRDYESNFKKQASNDSIGSIESAVEVTVKRDPLYKDFGISIADNFFGSGILISKVRNGSPADESSFLQPFAQIYKVSSWLIKVPKREREHKFKLIHLKINRLIDR